MVVANSRAGEAYWREESRGRVVPTRVIQNALPLSEIDGIQPARPDSVGIGDRLILYAGRLDSQKNIPVFFRALPKILNSGAFQVLICGEGPDLGVLRELVSELGVAGRVQFLGYVDNLYALMKAADVCVSVSRYEGQPNSVMEAMACRCPLVVSDIPEHREFLNEGNAFFAPVDASDAIATQLRACLTSSESAREKAVASRRVAEQWDIGTTVRNYLETYQAVMSQTIA